MSTETVIPNPAPVAASAAPDVKPQAAAPVAIHAEKSPAAEKPAMPAPAAKPKPDGLQLLLQELASPDPEQRAMAARALGRLADVASAPALILALHDSDADVAREAATSLGVLGNAAAVEPLLAILTNPERYFHYIVRVAAIHSLGLLRDPRTVEPLLNAIRDPMAEVSAEAIHTLAAMPDPRVLPALLGVVRNEDGFFLPTTRRAAIRGLAQIGGEQAACELSFVAANQWEDAAVRVAAIEATGNVPPAAV